MNMHAENKLTHLDFCLAVAKGLLEGHVLKTTEGV